MKTLKTATALCALFSAAPAAWAISPAESWDAFEKLYTQSGATVTVGGREELGANLRLTDVSIRSAMDGVESVISVPLIELRETGDARTSITLPEPVMFDIDGPDGEQLDQSFKLTTDLETVLTGTLEDLTMDMSGQRLAIESVEAEPETGGDGADAELVQITAVFEGIEGKQSLRQGEKVETQQVMTAKSGSLQASGEDAEGGTFNMAAKLTAIGLEADGTMIEGGQNDLAQLVRNGGGGGGMVSIGEVEFEMSSNPSEAQEDAAPVAVEGTANDVSLGVAARAEGLEYRVSTGVQEILLTSPELPVPFPVTLGSSLVELRLPLLANDEPQDVNFTYDVNELALGESVWEMFDPAQNLPRDPISIALGLRGSLELAEDLLAQSGEALDEMPNFKDLVADLSISALGAKVEGDAEMEFVGETSTNLEDARGTVDLRYDGLNGLISSLVAAGIVPEDQVMAVNMFLMMGAKPVEGEADAYTTHVEMREDGIFANGVQIR